MPATNARYTFLLKPIGAVALVGVLDWAWQGWRIGSWLGAWALGSVLVLLAVRPALRRGPALLAAAIAALYALVLAYAPGLLAWLLFWTALSIAVLLPRTHGFDDAWRWALRLCGHVATGPFAPLFDLVKLLRVRRTGVRRRSGWQRLAPLLLPVIGSAVFLALFAAANPLIEAVLGQITLPPPGEIAFWIAALLALWPLFRPRAVVTRLVGGIAPVAGTLPSVGAGSLLLSLIAFNAVFAIENGLDLAFLWSGAALPAGVTLAEYAHRGAYPLIATALLAGLFVLAALRPGSDSAANPAVRRLVVLWVAQNVLLVASSILRTCDYIAVYMLTAWRIAAFAWMALVALGLVLICWRMLRGRSAAWLINANALAATLVLSAGSVVDPDATAATWNVRHAREVGGTGVPLDLCQMHQVGSSALLALVELQQRPLAPRFRDRVLWVQREILLGDSVPATAFDVRGGLILEQANWRTWTWRGAYRLQQATAELGHRSLAPALLPAGYTRGCDGAPVAPPQPDATPVAEPTPLTKDPRP